MSNPFKSPMCSCIVCKKEYSAKGIFTHFFSTHDENGKYIMADIRSKGSDATFRKPEFQKQHAKPKITKPKHICLNSVCNNLTTTKFCSHSCAAIVTNSNRSDESYKQQGKTLIANKLKTGWIPKKCTPKIKHRICVVCNRVDETTGRFQSDVCMYCNDSLTYRMACKFTFDIRNYPGEFNINLLLNHGMFNPRTNPKGVSKDHILSVSYGKSNNIDPKIIAHPANCQLLLQGDNARKQGRSDITLENLLIKIDTWDKKYGCQGGNRTT